ncbi:MAG TPA: DMT family transporter [Aestuariivirgaceae bacterium]|jgi:drug/metabolite transporter (DMT)-like permease|nr:DMT family transporter [Aestuariivirgaceae bacterium]
MTDSKYRLGLALITASAVAWSTAGLFTRILALNGWTMLVWRGLFGALGIAAFMAVLEGREGWASALRMGWPGLLFAVCSAIGMLFFISSLTHTTVAHVAVIYATVPFIAAALAWLFLGEKPAASALVASTAAFAGVALMVGLSVEGTLLGDLLAFGMTLSVSAMTVIARCFSNISVLSAAGLSALLSAVVSWPLGEPLAVNGHELLVLALFGVVNSAVGLGLFTVGARFLPAIETALIGSLDAPLAPLWVWLAFDETPSTITLIGSLVVFTAVGVHLVVSAMRPRA